MEKSTVNQNQCYLY